ncbi:hypothetical protein DICVIV_04847 [Dictyocaulus viviparus]|uniref:Uncharacterized protein n=1 Tax=Dictyocaulus viviparus TaxID=29172 RepID=A0A0D8XZ17_DICVI|nr:hypothetical protein DICVIV_04847 [Dictyocaulus viviparus]
MFRYSINKNSDMKIVFAKKSIAFKELIVADTVAEVFQRITNKWAWFVIDDTCRGATMGSHSLD